MDGEIDGKDRAILTSVLSNAGAEIDVAITPEGVREPAEGKLSVRTKWLVVGDVGDPSLILNDSAKKTQILDVQAQHKLLTQEAREHGIKIVSLKGFLTYMGWKPESRLYIPGANAPFTLTAGARSTGTNQAQGDRSSNGATSKSLLKK